MFGVSNEKKAATQTPATSKTEKPTSQASRALDLLTHQALTLGASDIHLERRNKVLSLRFRVDGILRAIDAPLPELHEGLIACIKVLAHMRTDVRTLPQDGRYTLQHSTGVVDVRVSIVPAYWGEKVVLRLLRKPAGRRALEDLGFSAESSACIKKAIHQPDGLVLVTGPTGSGKTTTLYEMLETVSERDISVVSLEDPVEYGLDRVTQIPIREKQQFNFSTALRALLRQDPDVIMVGEIRDPETAELAATAALTGHLVLSTLHTMDAARTIVRLLTMGVPDHLVAPSLSLVVSQRLARKVCEKCAAQVEVPRWCLEMSPRVTASGLAHEKKGAGCSACLKTGYAGRTVLSEVLLVDDPLRDLIRSQARSADIKSHLKKVEWKDIFDSGIEAVRAGRTTLEEVFRVIQK